MKDGFLTIRCPETLKTRLRQQAELDCRKIADEARFLIELALADLPARMPGQAREFAASLAAGTTGQSQEDAIEAAR